MKKIVFPIAAILLLVIIAMATCSNKNKIELTWDNVAAPNNHVAMDSIDLRVYVENSGSMDGYMCAGSDLKDAVFDYVGNLMKYSKTTSLNYINSQVIPYRGNLESYIKGLTPSSFAAAGGNRANTDLRQIFKRVMLAHKHNTISVLVSDCILDIPGNANDFFGNCQISIKNTFNEALEKNPDLGVEIAKLNSKFEGYWYCGKEKEKLTHVKRPYYIWIIGDKHVLASLNQKSPVNDIYGGIKDYCAFSGSSPIPFHIEKKVYMITHDKIKVQVLADLRESLQSDLVLTNPRNYKTSNSTDIIGINDIVVKGSIYSHAIDLEIRNPQTVKSEMLSFSYPSIPSWAVASNDTTGRNVMKNIDKTTGILYLVRGVANAYESSGDYGTITFNLRNK